jgi:hypothetical protein
MTYPRVQLALEAQVGKDSLSAKLGRFDRVPEVQRPLLPPQLRLLGITDFGFSLVVALTSILRWALNLKVGFV